MEIQLQIYINYLLFFVAGIMAISAVWHFKNEDYFSAMQSIFIAVLNCLVALFLPFS
jgi:hypothetical protein